MLQHLASSMYFVLGPHRSDVLQCSPSATVSLARHGCSEMQLSAVNAPSRVHKLTTPQSKSDTCPLPMASCAGGGPSPTTLPGTRSAEIHTAILPPTHHTQPPSSSSVLLLLVVTLTRTKKIRSGVIRLRIVSLKNSVASSMEACTSLLSARQLVAEHLGLTLQQTRVGCPLDTSLHTKMGH